MNLVSEELKKRPRGATLALMQFLGRGQPVFNAWLKDENELDIEDVIQICRFFKWRPAWALFHEGPKSDAEAHELALIRDVIALLGDDVRHAVGNAQYVPVPRLKEQIAETTRRLSALMGQDLVEIPPPIFAVLKSTSTLLRQINVPQVLICRSSQRLEAVSTIEDVPQGDG